MKKESMIGRRLYAWIIDTFLLCILVFFIDGFISTPIMNNTTDIQNVVESYSNNSDIYSNLQDEYHFYYYDGNDNRIQNENITDEMKEAFLNDPRVIDITDKLYKEQGILLKTLIIKISLSIFVGAAIVYLVLPLFFKKGRTLGKLIAKLVLVKNNNYISWYQGLLRNFLSIIFNIYLAIVTMGILPLINLIIAIAILLLVLSYKKENEENEKSIDSLKEEIEKLKKELEE